MKRKININRPQISSDEINQRKNFDSVLKTHLKASKPFFKKTWFLSSVVVSAVAVVATILLLNNNTKTNSNEQLVENVLPTNTELLAFYEKEEAKPCIAPPINGLNVAYTTYKVNAGKGATINYKTGSIIEIPKNAFTDDSGNLVKGDIEIRYREFHDVAEIFVSGIPMTYDSAGVRYHFESAGMMQIEGYQNGKKVNIAPDKKINVQLASNDNSTKYNLYELDTNKNNWSCLGKDKVVAKKMEQTNNSSDFIKTPSVEQSSEYVKIETEKSVYKVQKEEKIAALPKAVLEVKIPQKVSKEKNTFDLDISIKEFPEFAIYKEVLFEVGSENKDFNKSYYDIEWNDVTITEGNKKGENYLLTLKKGAKIVKLIVYPVFEGKNYETAMKTYQEKFEKYNVALEKRIENEKKIEEEYQQKLAVAIKKQEELERKWKEQQDNRFRQMDTEMQTKRMFAVNRFGVYNCDNPMAYPQGKICTANLTTDKKAQLMIYDVYLVDKSKNGMFTYAKNPITKFSYNPDAQNILWTVENGVLYYLMPEDFSDIKNKDGMANIPMKRVDQSFKTIDELKAFFKL